VDIKLNVKFEVIHVCEIDSVSKVKQKSSID
jgi:hypothetical protein